MSDLLPLSAVAAVRRSRVLPKSRPDLRFIGLGEVESQTMRVIGFLDATTMRSSAILFEPGDVLYGRLRPYLNKVFVAREQGLASTEFIPLTPAPGVSGKWLSYRLNSSDFVFYASHLKDGDRPRVDWDQISPFPIQIPSLPEQERVVSAIEAQFSRLDATVASLTRAKAKVKRARASVLKAAVEGRLVPTEAALARAEGRDFEPASALLARILAARKAAWTASGRRSMYKVPVPPGVVSQKNLPEGWKWASMDELADIVGGITKDSKRTEGRLVPYLRVANVQRGRLDLSEIKHILATEQKISSLRLQPGDVLLIEGGDRDKLGRGWIWQGEIQDCIHQNHVFRARLWLGVFDTRFLSHFANVEGERYFFREGKQTTNLASISLSKLKALPVALPPAQEITRILAEVDRRLSVLDALDRTLDANLARCARLRQAILKRAFEGRLAPAEKALAG